ncbi:MAG TPA: polysaccharide deacetylase family protein [Cyanobacteria bacterium UBA8803]|nr:polysaccharide deacetylase family protein [Cyanobacteria bacterium UBA9273]HBL59589.1 polysaccharide deacetylase family protein [Cyanobacteria bacterium UBA8803]
MENPRLFVWQYRISLTVIASVLSFFAGLSLPVHRSITPKIASSISQPKDHNSSVQNRSNLKVGIGQQQDIYKKAIAQLKQEQAKRLNFAVPAQFQGKTLRDVQLKDGRKTIALTFDDGPWPHTTSQVLNILKKQNIKATFFVVGRNVKNYPHIMKQVVKDGHAIGNHTWHHQYHNYSPGAAARELNDTAALIYKVTGVKTSLFRPPAGILTNGLTAYAHQKKYAVIMWSVDSQDWQARNATPKAMSDSIVKNTKPGGIILLHDGGGDRTKTVQALPLLIAELKKQGYQFVTVPQLLEMQNKELQAMKG